MALVLAAAVTKLPKKVNTLKSMISMMGFLFKNERKFDFLCIWDKYWAVSLLVFQMVDLIPGDQAVHGHLNIFASSGVCFDCNKLLVVSMFCPLETWILYKSYQEKRTPTLRPELWRDVTCRPIAHRRTLHFGASELPLGHQRAVPYSNPKITGRNLCLVRSWR